MINNKGSSRINQDKLFESVTSEFEKKDWFFSLCSNCKAEIISKSLLCTCMYCIDDVRVERKNVSKINNPLPSFTEYLMDYLSKHHYISRVPSKRIWDTSDGQVFVGSGLESIYGYIYGTKPKPSFPYFIMQPSIRMRVDNKVDKYITKMSRNGYSLSFINLSIITELKNEIDFYNSLDFVISLLSHLGLHAQRIKLHLDRNIYSHRDGLKSYVIRIFIDNVEVGDHVALISKKASVIETGFGLERLIFTRNNIGYKDLFDLERGGLDLENSIRLQLITLFAMSTVPVSETVKLDKIMPHAKYLESNVKEFDTFQSHRFFYRYWAPYVSDPLDEFNSFMKFLKIINRS